MERGSRGSPPVTKYQVGYYFNSELELVWEDVPGGAGARTYTVTGLEIGKVYSVGVRAVNGRRLPVLLLFKVVDGAASESRDTGRLHGGGGLPEAEPVVDGGGLGRDRGAVPVPAESRRPRPLGPLERHPRQRQFDHQLHHKRPSGRYPLHGPVADAGPFAALRRGERDRENGEPAERLHGRARRAHGPQGDAIAQLSRGPVLVGSGIEWRQGDHEVRAPSQETEWILRFLVFRLG